MNTIQEYISLAKAVTVTDPYIRYGQALFNILHDNEPEIADEIIGTELDPFHQDDRVEDFVVWLEGKLIELNEGEVK